MARESGDDQRPGRSKWETEKIDFKEDACIDQRGKMECKQLQKNWGESSHFPLRGQCQIKTE